jgi:hypothetical protein
MVIIAAMSYLPESVKEMAKRFTTMAALPNFITMRGPYVSSVRRDDIQILSKYEFEEGKLTGAMQVAGKRMVAYYGVPGFTYSLTPWLDVQEAMSMIS